MSKARLVITAVVVEGRSQGEVARAYGVSQGWVSRLVARYRAEGEAAFEARSRRAVCSPQGGGLGATVAAAVSLTECGQRPGHRADYRAAEGTGGAGSGRRAADDLLAPA